MAAYTEPVFMMLVVLAFMALRQGRWRTAALVAALATVARSAGILLVLPLVVEGLRTLRASAGMTALPALAALAAWNGYLAWRFHGSGTPSMNNPAVQRHLDWPWYGIVRDAQALGYTILIA
jgi:Gpi18-like mannosyltransferase